MRSDNRSTMNSAERSEIRDGMQIDWDVPIKTEDGLVLRADVFRPTGSGRHPVMLTYGPYAKGLSSTATPWMASSALTG